MTFWSNVPGTAEHVGTAFRGVGVNGEAFLIKQSNCPLTYLSLSLYLPQHFSLPGKG
jgi:hypothetical protein